MTKEAKILIGIAGVVLIGGVLLAIFANPQPKDPGAPVDSQSLVREHSYMTGKKEAKVTLVEFGDFQCPSCRAAFPMVKSVIESYKDNSDFNFVFRNLPLDAIHPNAHVSAEAAEAAGAQGKYWEMQEKLYLNQSQWAELPNPIDAFASFAQELGLDVDKFKSEVEQRRYADVIAADVKDFESLGVSKSTPTFFLNGVKLETTPRNADELKGLIDAELAK